MFLYKERGPIYCRNDHRGNRAWLFSASFLLSFLLDGPIWSNMGLLHCGCSQIVAGGWRICWFQLAGSSVLNTVRFHNWLSPEDPLFSRGTMFPSPFSDCGCTQLFCPRFAISAVCAHLHFLIVNEKMLGPIRGRRVLLSLCCFIASFLFWSDYPGNSIETCSRFLYPWSCTVVICLF